MWSRRLQRLIVLGLSSCALAACDLVLGLDDFADPPPGAGGSGGAGAASGGGGPGSGGMGGIGGAATGGGTPQGDVVWARSFGGKETQIAQTLALGPNEEIVIAGSTTGDIELTWFDSTCDEPPSLSPPDGSDPFIIALEPDGCHAWAELVPVTIDGGGHITDVAVAGPTIWAVGGFFGTLFAGEDYSSTATGATDAFWASLVLSTGAATDSGVLPAGGGTNREGEAIVAANASQVVVGARINVAGDPVVAADIRVDAVVGASWSWLLASTGLDQAHAIVLDGGDLLVAGEIGGGNANFGGACGTHVADGTDGFVAVLQAETGACQWKEVFSGAGRQRATAVAKGSDGIYVGGSYDDTITFPDGSTASGSGGDAFVVKLDGNGDLQWKRTSGGASGEERVEALAVTSAGNLAVAGWFSAGLGFTGASSPNQTNRDGFVMLLDGEGDVQWASVLAGDRWQLMHDVAVAPGVVYALGALEAQATLGAVSLPHGGGAETHRDVVVAKFNELSAGR